MKNMTMWRTDGASAAFVLRLVLGIVFLAHGYAKLFQMGIPAVGGFFGQIGIPLAMVAATIVTLLEFFGGIALILGLFVRWAALLLAVQMFVALVWVHAKNGFFLTPEKMGFEFALTLIAGLVALALLGAGRWSLDKKMKKE